MTRRGVLVDDGLGYSWRQGHIAQTDDAVVGFDLDHGPRMEAEGTADSVLEHTRSMALEQKLPWGGTVLPFHIDTARTDLIFIQTSKKSEWDRRPKPPENGLDGWGSLAIAVGGPYACGDLQRLPGGSTLALPWPAMS
jgi:hypothetical protein